MFPFNLCQIDKMEYFNVIIELPCFSGKRRVGFLILGGTCFVRHCSNGAGVCVDCSVFYKHRCVQKYLKIETILRWYFLLGSSTSPLVEIKDLILLRQLFANMSFLQVLPGLRGLQHERLSRRDADQDRQEARGRGQGEGQGERRQGQQGRETVTL